MDYICIPIHSSSLYTLIVVTRGYSMQPYYNARRMCIVLTIPELWCLRANCVGCWHLLGYSTLCICRLECVSYLVYCFVVSRYVKAFPWVGVSGK
jgi:hypothetical protein